MKATFLLLTYKTHLPKDEYKEWFNTKVLPTEAIAMAHETGDTDYPHTHVVVKLDKSRTISKKRVQNGFDYKGIHPNLEVLKGKKGWNNALKYISKEDKDIGVEIEPDFQEILDKIRSSKTVDDLCKLMIDKDDIIPYLRMWEFKTTTKRDKEYFEKIKALELMPHQQRWLNILDEQDDYEILWVVDYPGKIGKSTFCKWMKTWTDFIKLSNGKTNDLTKAYEGQEYVIFDFSRTSEEITNYQAIEDIKNGHVFSGKYYSHTKFHCPPKVLCFSNWYPNTKALSEERWNIIEYTERDKRQLGLPKGGNNIKLAPLPPPPSYNRSVRTRS